MSNFIIKKGDDYKGFFIPEYLMGPNCIRLLDELLAKYPLDFSRNETILDLGCGKGLTSLFIARETNATVYANDLWIPAEENLARFKEWGMDDVMLPSHEDANNLTFAPETFDALISVDSYHYFAGKEGFFTEKILPCLRKGGTVLIAMPGMKEKFEGQQESLIRDWLGDECQLFHSCNWWKNIIGESEDIASVATWEMANADIAWDEWLCQDHDFAASDRVYESIIRKYTTFVALAIKKK